jgi:hypothetical protein
MVPPLVLSSWWHIVDGWISMILAHGGVYLFVTRKGCSTWYSFVMLPWSPHD